MFCTRRPARDLFYPQHFKRLNSSRRDPRLARGDRTRCLPAAAARGFRVLAQVEKCLAMAKFSHQSSAPSPPPPRSARLGGAERCPTIRICSSCQPAVLQCCRLWRCWLHFMMRRIALQFTESGFWFWLSPGAGCSVVECGGWCCTKLEIQRSPSTPSLAAQTSVSW